MNRKESIEIAERELGRKKEIKRDDSFDRADYDAPIEVEAYTEGFNEMRDKAIPLLADKIMEIEKLKKEKEHGDWLVAEVKKVGIGGIEVQFKVLQIKNTELQQKLDESKKAIKWCDDESCGKNVEIAELKEADVTHLSAYQGSKIRYAELKQKLDRVEKENTELKEHCERWSNTCDKQHELSEAKLDMVLGLDIAEIAQNTLSHYQHSKIYDDEGCNLHLVDLLTPEETTSINEGQDEILYISEDIALVVKQKIQEAVEGE